MNSAWRTIAAVLGILLLLGSIEGALWLARQAESAGQPAVEELVSQSEPESEPEPEPKVIAVESYSMEYPVDKLIIVEERQKYSSGDMTLEVPRMNFSGPVLAAPVSEDTLEEGSGGVPDELLQQGVGLFGFSQLPSEKNANVAIAGHRDIYSMEFYDIDKITNGDRMYLTYQGRRYTYEYLETTITDPYDWSMIKVRDIGCLTLQSCDPINVASHRIFVVAKLVQIEILD